MPSTHGGHCPFPYAVIISVLNLLYHSRTVLEANLVSNSHLSGGSIAHVVEKLVKHINLLLTQRIFKRYTELVELVRKLRGVDFTLSVIVYRILPAGSNVLGSCFIMSLSLYQLKNVLVLLITLIKMKLCGFTPIIERIIPKRSKIVSGIHCLIISLNQQPMQVLLAKEFLAFPANMLLSLLVVFSVLVREYSTVL